MDHLIQLLSLFAVFTCAVGNTIVYYHIQEERQPNILLGKVGDDANITNTGVALSYKFLTAGSQHLEKFDIDDKSGALSTKEKLDRETLCRLDITCQIKLIVAAVGISALQKIEVRVVVEDINDNAPVFRETVITREISEGSVTGTKIPLIGATDEDMVGNNSLKGYELQPPSEFFRLFVSEIKPDGTSDVALQLIKTLDRETEDSYKIYLIAKDGGDPPNTGMLTIDITVTDVNDFKPEFSKDRYEVTVDENIPINSQILLVKATDRDIGANAEIKYSFSDRVGGDFQKFFKINENTGNITLIKQLEYSLGTNYEFIVEATDQGNSPNNDQAVVVVNVKDTNNKVPQIIINLLTGTGYTDISEGAPHDKVIAHIEAVDRDTGVNGEVNCTLVHKTNTDFLFRMTQIERNEFMILLNGKLDREQMIEHVVTIYCEDGGTPSLNSTDSFSVIVIDENDNPPEFTNNIYLERIAENTEPPTMVTKVSATDFDQGANAEVRYYLSDDVTSKFSIDTKSGIIETRTKFDREEQSYIEFKVFAVDSGLTTKFTATATVQLTITDVNDLTPDFTQDLFEFEVYEQTLVAFGNVTAKDGDAGVNGQVTYVIPQEYATLPFAVSEHGELSTHRALDREAKDFYEFTVFARDKGLHARQSVARVTVRVLDVNDNAPVITFPNDTNSSVILSYKAEPDSLVTTIEAKDADIGVNSEMSFVMIQGNEDGLFKMDFNSGEILLARKIKLHEIKVYKIYFAVEDGGSPQMSTQKSISIQVIFVNSTMVLDKEPVSTSNNVLIVIAIGCITVVLSTVIIIMICIIRKLDAKKRNYKSKTTEEMKIIETMGRSSNRSSSSKGSRDGFISSLDKSGKKEVSFSLDDEQDSRLTFTVPPNVNGSQMMTFKSQSPSQEDNLNKQLEKRPVLHSRENSDSRQKQVHRMASLRVQQQLLQSQHNASQYRPQKNDDDMRKMSSSKDKVNHDDNNSDLSVESTTSDSGRGGSEEDIRNTGLTNPELDSSRNLSTTDSSGFSSLSQTSSANSRPVFKTFGLQDNPSRTQSPVNGGTFPRKAPNLPNTRHLQPVHRPVHAGHRNHRLPSGENFSLHQNPHPHRQFIDIPRVPSDLHSSKNSLASGDHRNLARTSRNSHLNYDDSLSESFATTNRDDDDATTTSGSYTVNAEELCNEIDDLFFKPDTVV